MKVAINLLADPWECTQNRNKNQGICYYTCRDHCRVLDVVMEDDVDTLEHEPPGGLVSPFFVHVVKGYNLTQHRRVRIRSVFRRRVAELKLHQA